MEFRPPSVRFGSFVLGAILSVTVVGTSLSWATEKTLVNFSGSNGNGPVAGLVLDSKGNIYGTTSSGGSYGNGTVFRLSPGVGGTWKQSLLYSFPTVNPKAPWGPFSSVTLDSVGNLYGTTYYGGSSTGAGTCQSGCGTVYRLTPTTKGAWKETTLYSFKGGKDGAGPSAGVTFDSRGNLYGTTAFGGGTYNSGTVFRLTPTTTGPWKETILHAFTGSNIGGDGSGPQDAPTLDQFGNIFGTTLAGGVLGTGTVFELSPTSSGGWSYSIIHSFPPPTLGGTDAANPIGGVLVDSAGNLYGTGTGGAFALGAVFELSPSASGWTSTVLYSFEGLADGAAPKTSLVQDPSGNLYGTVTENTVNGQGGVFELTSSGNNAWTESVLLSFDGVDGTTPWAPVIIDGEGNIFGTAEFGGTSGDGVVFEITQ